MLCILEVFKCSTINAVQSGGSFMEDHLKYWNSKALKFLIFIRYEMELLVDEIPLKMHLPTLNYFL